MYVPLPSQLPFHLGTDTFQTNGSTIWEGRVNRLLNSTLTTFFPDNIAYEVACEPALTCTTDMFSFKGYLTRWLAATTLVAPFTKSTILPVLAASAKAAAAQCSGGADKNQCGFSWSKQSAWDGTVGVGQQMAAMSVVFVNMLALEDIKAPVTNGTGGTSVGNPDAGAKSTDNPQAPKPVTGADRAGAGILTTILLVGAAGMFGWMSKGN